MLIMLEKILLDIDSSHEILIYIISNFKMNKSLALKNKLSLLFLLIISVLILIYLAFFLLNGDRGVVSYFKIKKLNSYYQSNLTDLNEKNNNLLDKIARLHTNTIDLDFLDEKIKEITGKIEHGEIIIKLD